MGYRLVLASASPARLSTLRNAGLNPEVIISGVGESGVQAGSTAELARQLAELKAEAVATNLITADAVEMIIIGCDSVLEFAGQAYGKPGTAEVAIDRWRTMRGRSGVLHTGHHLIVEASGQRSVLSRTASTTVHFAELSDAEIDAYVGTGEPLLVAGGFTLDGMGGPFISRIEGDPHNVVGISLPLLREMLNDLGVGWQDLWAQRAQAP